ncbi:phage tail protein [Flavobacterium collinsii]|jgi:microcystin-dependent protein|uniref:Collar domain-containing protein n=1 Tax=Flavobacterium collinsii TaxID=1114861 RepID=A0A9W4TK83_9FLAO|nr:tail fiber protein [Flavobacterium collinsii]GIQ61042.1 tail Collar domain-containing protein [Flavobacterium collinsii]CAA9202788.1 hypothetical protein FLACOL7796_04432 [Flavobacterium collinsii]CAI2768720.1 Collar domain-containing protein [Flavobacterium collinsii]
MEDYIGVIKLFSGNFIPKGWMFCNGQELDIVKYTPLYSVIGKSYGEAKSHTFRIPDLCGRVPVGIGSIDEKSKSYNIGEKAGEESTILNYLNIPPLRGGFSDKATLGIPCATLGGDSSPVGKIIGDGNTTIFSNATPNPTDTLKPFNLNKAISDDHIVYTNFNKEPIVPVSNVQPVLGIIYIICYQGLFPEREQ